MQKTLLKYDFGGPILSEILALYSSPSARVYTSSTLSHEFPISNGTRQGCPLSPSIFNLLIEPLAEAIRSSPNIKGFRFNSTSHKLNLFANDVIIFLTDPLTSLGATHDLLVQFSGVSYYKVNFHKSLILDLGVGPALRAKIQNVFPYTWSTDNVPYLGIHLTPKPSHLADANYPCLITKLTSECQRLSKAILTWSGH